MQAEKCLSRVCSSSVWASKASRPIKAAQPTAGRSMAMAKRCNKSLGNVISRLISSKDFGGNPPSLVGLGRLHRRRTPLSDNPHPPLRSYRNCATPSATSWATCMISIRVRDAVPGGELHEIDHWVLVRALYLVAHSRIAYDEYAFNRATAKFTTSPPPISATSTST